MPESCSYHSNLSLTYFSIDLTSLEVVVPRGQRPPVDEESVVVPIRQDVVRQTTNAIITPFHLGAPILLSDTILHKCLAFLGAHA